MAIYFSHTITTITGLLKNSSTTNYINILSIINYQVTSNFDSAPYTRWLLPLARSLANGFRAFDKRCIISVVFFDIKKAFDAVDDQILTDRLKCYGIHDEELKFLNPIWMAEHGVVRSRVPRPL